MLIYINHLNLIWIYIFISQTEYVHSDNYSDLIMDLICILDVQYAFKCVCALNAMNFNLILESMNFYILNAFIWKALFIYIVLLCSTICKSTYNALYRFRTLIGTTNFDIGAIQNHCIKSCIYLRSSQSALF